MLTAPPLPKSVWSLVKTQFDKERVFEGSADMSTAPPLEVELPSATVRPDMETLTSPMLKTRPALLPLTVSSEGPGLTRVRSWKIDNGPLVRLIWPLTAKLIVSPAEALRIAWRSEPAPLSFRFRTVSVESSVRGSSSSSQGRTRRGVRAALPRRRGKCDGIVISIWFLEESCNRGVA